MKALSVWTGPVSSQKSTRAGRRAERMRRLGYDLPFVVRPERSIRKHEHESPGYLVTKAGLRFPSLELESAGDIEDACACFGAVWIDEPMLFDDEDAVFPAVQALRKVMPVLVSGLSATSELEVFGISMSKILSVADHVSWCTADCDGCLRINAATRSFEIAGKKEGQVLVGGTDVYQALCPECWEKAMSARCG